MEWEMGKGGSQIKITVYYGTSVHLSIQYSTVRQVEGEIGRSTPGDFAVLGSSSPCAGLGGTLWTDPEDFRIDGA